MAFDTLPHAPALVRQSMQVFNLPMASTAGNFAVDMTLVVEYDMLGYIVDFYPWCRCLGIEILVFFLNPRMFGNDVIMTVQTFFHRGNTRKVGIGHVGMAVLALYLFNTAVDIVAKWDGLFRTDLGQR